MYIGNLEIKTEVYDADPIPNQLKYVQSWTMFDHSTVDQSPPYILAIVYTVHTVVVVVVAVVVVVVVVVIVVVVVVVVGGGVVVVV